MIRTISCAVAASLAFALLAGTPATAQEQGIIEEGEAQPFGEGQFPQPVVVTTKPSDAGRFQLFEGQYSITPVKSGEVPERQLFRIDTTTGEVWIGKQVQFTDKKSNRLVQQRYWEPFEQYLTAPAERPRP